MKTEAIGGKIKKVREEAGMSQKALADLLGVTEAAVSNYETGKRGIRPEVLKKISEIFNVSIDNLLGNPVEEIKLKIDLVQLLIDFENADIYINENLLNKDERVRCLQAMITEYFHYGKKADGGS